MESNLPLTHAHRSDGRRLCSHRARHIRRNTVASRRSARCPVVCRLPESRRCERARLRGTLTGTCRVCRNWTLFAYHSAALISTTLNVSGSLYFCATRSFVSVFVVQAVEENANESEEELGSEEEEDGSSTAMPKPAAKRTAAGGSKLKGAARGKK